MLDEGHTIRNPSAQQTRAALSLEGRRRWALTGAARAGDVQRPGAAPPRVPACAFSERCFMSVSGSFGTVLNLFLSGDLRVSSLGGFWFVFFVVWVAVSLVVCVCWNFLVLFSL